MHEGAKLSKKFLGYLWDADGSIGQKVIVGSVIAAAGYLYDAPATRRALGYDSPPTITFKNDEQLKKEALLRLISNKTTGTEEPTPPLDWDPFCSTRVVYLVSENIGPQKYRISENTHKYFLRALGISLKAACHWSIVVIHRSRGMCWRYDLMSDQKWKWGKNYFRADEVTDTIIGHWLTCTYIGETTADDDKIRALGQSYIDTNPRYDTLMTSCQTILESLVRSICDGKMISTPTAWRELQKALPAFAAYYYVTWKTKETIIKMAEWCGQKMLDTFEEDVKLLQEAFKDI